jgi:phospholipase A2
MSATLGARCLPSWVSGEVLEKVDVSCKLCPEERAYISARQPSVDKALLDFAGRDASLTDSWSPPTVSLCCSGGGYRAMTATLGCLLGLEEIGLLPGIKYMATLSGSSWCIGHLLLRMQEENVNLKQFREIAQKRIEEDVFDPTKSDLSEITIEILRILSERFRFEPADLMGILIADQLFGDMHDPQNITFSKIRNLLEGDSHDMPFPLFSLILSDLFPYEWLEVNPFMTGSDYFCSYIRTRAFDSQFSGGSCYKLFQERSLGWFLAMFGSAYNVSLGDMLMELAKNDKNDFLIKVVNGLIDKIDLHELRAFSSPVNNFSWKMKVSPLADREQIELSDAGIAFNIPFPLIQREGRESDIIIVCSAGKSANNGDYRELKFAKEYSKRKGHKFPPLDNPKKINDHLLIFEDEVDQDVPIIVYFINPVEVPTFTLEYSQELFDSVCDSMKNLVLGSKAVLIDLVGKRGSRG